MGMTIAICLGAYLLGAVPFGVVLSRLILHRDPRSVGSRNIGAINVFRHVHPLLGILTLICDGAKGWFPVWFALMLRSSPWEISLVGLTAFFGHLFPVYLSFRGGKGVATGAGIFLAMAPYAALGSMAVFLLGATVLSRYASLGSLMAAVALPPMVWYSEGIHPYLLAAAICAAGVFWSHRGNIGRLVRGTERPWRSPKRPHRS